MGWLEDIYDWGSNLFNGGSSNAASGASNVEDLFTGGYSPSSQAQSMINPIIDSSSNFNTGGSWSSGLAGALVTGVGGLAQTYFNQKQQRQIGEQQSKQWQAQFDYQKGIDDRNYALAQAGLAQQAAATAAQAKEAKRRTIVDAYNNYLDTATKNEAMTQKGYQNLGDAGTPLSYRSTVLK